VEGLFGTGAAKCFNTAATCQSAVSLDLEDVTRRFSRADSHYPADIEALPYIVGIEFSPPVLSLGQDLGQRSNLKVTLSDHQHPDAGPGLDKYHAERGYNPRERGTFFGRLRARQPFLRTQEVNLYMGFVGDALADMERRTFLVDSFQGPDAQGQCSIVAKDPLKFLDGDRAQAPRLSNGFLVADINNSTTSATLSPSGIGNEEYPASGHICIGGNEVCSFTRSGDALTLTRAQLGTTASAHSAQDRVQVVLRYAAQDAANILYDLETTYAGLPTSYFTLASWQAETAAHLGVLYTATITEPTSVSQLVSELIEQAALAHWWDDVEQQLRLQVLRAISTDAFVFDEDNIRDDSGKRLAITEQPEKRISQCQVLFGQIDPTKPLGNKDNYRSAAVTLNAEAEENFGVAIKQINSRWIPAGGRSVAEALGRKQVGRFAFPPRKAVFDVMRLNVETPALGAGYQLGWPFLQDASGAREALPIQVTRLAPSIEGIGVTAEEMRFDVTEADDHTDRIISIDFSQNNINLRTLHDSIYPVPTSGTSVTFRVVSGVTIGSTSTAVPSVNVGSWPAGVTVLLENRGRIQGKGGRGGAGGGNVFTAGQAGLVGGSALYARSAIELDNAGGQIYGGGGGGGGGGGFSGGGGGGGQGSAGGEAGNGGVPSGLIGAAGSRDAPGAGAPGPFGSPIPGGGGLGGGPGAAGAAGQIGATSSTPGAGGAAGAAIDGVSYLTISAAGTITGSQIN
jgi:hypothetical protein